MKRLLLLALTLTLAAAATTQAGNEKKRTKSNDNAGGSSRAVGPTERQGSAYSGGRVSYSASRHSRHTDRTYGSPVRHSKRTHRVRYY